MKNLVAWTCLLLFWLVSACQGDEPPSAMQGPGPGGQAGVAGRAGSGGTAGAAGNGPVSEPGVTIIQEDQLGFSAIEGKVLPREGSTSVTGYTGTGFADGDPGLGKRLSYNVTADRAGTFSLIFRYAFGGAEANLRDAKLLVNGTEAVPVVSFPYTVTWNDWRETGAVEVELSQGQNYIELEALYPSGLGNIDYLKILGEGITPSTPSFSVSVSSNDPEGGSVTVSPAEPYSAAGTPITVTAVAKPGYFFQSFSGDVTSPSSPFTFALSKNTSVIGIFLPDGTEQDPELVGYAAVQDDAGTPYIVTGGSLGASVTATSLDELKTFLERPEPLVVSFSGLFEGSDVIHIASNKTLLGVGGAAHLKGIELEINAARNVILRNIAVSHVVAEGTGAANDAIVITGGSKNVWIDHCELFSDLDHGKDYYDGLLEIKNEASFVTVSYSVFRDHYKVSLISSGDEQFKDTVIRATYHHNYFYACGSRLPSIRFGKAHVFNNYYKDNPSGSCVNSRMGAVVKVEHNYFENSSDTIGSWDSPSTGSWEVKDNVFLGCTGAQPTESTGSLPIAYPYHLDAALDVPAIVLAKAGVDKN